MENMSIKNNIENKNVELHVTLQLPYCGHREEYTDECIQAHRSRLLDTIGQFSRCMIDALTKRMNACVTNLYNHKDDVIYNNGIMIVYQRKDQSVHTFNVPSYEAMRNAIKALSQSDWEGFLKEPIHVDQTLKALFWVEAPKDKSGYIKYSDLISALMKIHMCNDIHKRLLL